MVIPVNWWAVLAAAVAYMVVGSLWYGPLFGKLWKRLMGYSNMDMKSMNMKASTAMILGLVSAVVMANVLAHEQFVWFDFFGATMGMAAFALQLAFWLWLGFVATTQLGSVLWENKSWKLFFLNAAGSLVGLVAMAFVLTYWQ